MELFNYRKIGGYTKKSSVILDDKLIELTKAADYDFNGESSFEVPSFEVPSDFTLGVIYGSSGTGKSTLLQEFGEVQEISWDHTKAVASQIDSSLLMRLGLSSIPSLCRPYHILSTGEKHRADIAASLKDGCVIDEFTSVCNRALAKSISIGLRSTIDKLKYKNIVIVTCHEDVIDWLEPDWTINTITRRLVEGRLKRQKSIYRVVPCNTKAWRLFKDHHYLSGDLNEASYCWLMLDENNMPCGFSSALPFPGLGRESAWREHRTVLHPDYQGIGIGSKLSEIVGQFFVNNGYRYFSKTAHPKLGFHRNHSKLWRATSSNMRDRQDYLKAHDNVKVGHLKKNSIMSVDSLLIHANRVCYSHEYIGERSEIIASLNKSIKTESCQLTLF
jgi:GNAT superfamily N-acetyltransferase